ncbi:AGE family epimerase/isomerase [Ciceribacter sp. L1K23]|uniref:AGE family epimerase/isomerase n=1 Tax=Ciceribacter sp. L1K23 TaxID=2820276 RepID=UPI001B840362|nr:AGE family epimerase/isomerase [Ciceribacter sp. L1K23]MBR0557041.1 AGE family epimerase/isomerase [Ciceribacter sp. L1K23]
MPQPPSPLDQAATDPPSLTARSTHLHAWLETAALPFWWEKGAASGGGFFERLGQDGEPMLADDRRARVQPRQVYCYVMSGAAGWNGPWPAAVEEGLSWFDATYRLEDGLYGNLANAEGLLIDPSFDLYNQAFALFAAAAVATAQPSRAAERELYALGILDRLKQVYAHPQAGFHEAMPPKEPLCSNPHMHLFEAAMAWEDVPDSSVRWAALVDEIADLALTRFIDGDTGALREFFDLNWRPMPGEKGRIVEPGHQFEWAWLLARWGERRQNGDALARARRLFDIGEAHGICADRKVAIMSLYDDFTVHNAMARLWPQTEWLKAAVRLALLGNTAERERYVASAHRALDALEPFLATPVKGLWWDKWPADAPMIDEPAPASTFYHIVCAVLELDWAAKRLERLREAG